MAKQLYSWQREVFQQLYSWQREVFQETTLTYARKYREKLKKKKPSFPHPVPKSKF